MRDFTKDLYTILNLEYLGIQFENTVNENGITKFFFSVPESSAVTVEGYESNDLLKTSDGLIKIAKQELTKSLVETCKEDDGDTEDNTYADDFVRDYVKFFAKVRVGEVWTDEMAAERIAELKKELEKINVYKEV